MVNQCRIYKISHLWSGMGQRLVTKNSKKLGLGPWHCPSPTLKSCNKLMLSYKVVWWEETGVGSWYQSMNSASNSKLLHLTAHCAWQIIDRADWKACCWSAIYYFWMKFEHNIQKYIYYLLKFFFSEFWSTGWCFSMPRQTFSIFLTKYHNKHQFYQ